MYSLILISLNSWRKFKIFKNVFLSCIVKIVSFHHDCIIQKTVNDFTHSQIARYSANICLHIYTHKSHIFSLQFHVYAKRAHIMRAHRDPDAIRASIREVLRVKEAAWCVVSHLPPLKRRETRDTKIIC